MNELETEVYNKIINSIKLLREITLENDSEKFANNMVKLIQSIIISYADKLTQESLANITIAMIAAENELNFNGVAS